MKNPNRFYVYAHQRLDDNSIFYIGKGTDKRAWTKRGRSNHWKNIVKKAGYRVLSIKDQMSETDAFTLEKYLIVFYGRADLGEGRLVNLTDGGDGTSGYKPSEESKKKMSESQKGIVSPNKGNTYSEETRKKLSDINKGNRNKLGTKLSEESKNKCSESQRGKKLSEETKNKMSERTKSCKWLNDGTKNFFINPEAALPHYTLGKLKKNKP
jgi:hypothetical protein